MPVHEYSLEEFARKLGVEAARLAEIDFRPALAVCSYLIQNDTRERFRRAEDPDGNRWKPLKHKPRVPKGRGVDQPLWATGRLVASTAAGAVGHVESIGRASLTIGTNVGYAGYHQDGTRHIPARPFLGVGRDLGDKIEDVLVKFVEDELIKGLGGS